MTPVRSEPEYTFLATLGPDAESGANGWYTREEADRIMAEQDARRAQSELNRLARDRANALPHTPPEWVRSLSAATVRNWRLLTVQEMAFLGDTSPLVSCVSDEELDAEARYGDLPDGDYVELAWTEDYVYGAFNNRHGEPEVLGLRRNPR